MKNKLASLLLLLLSLLLSIGSFAQSSLYPNPAYNTAAAQTFQTSLYGYTGQLGTTWQSPYHANWNTIRTQIPYNPTEWQIYTNAASGIATVTAGTNQVTLSYGTKFNSSWINLPYFYYEGTRYKVLDVIDSNHLTVSNLDGSAVSWPSNLTGTYYFVATSTTSVVNITGNTITYVSGQPFIPFFDAVYINGVQYTVTYVSPTKLTLSTSIGTLMGATLNQYKNISNMLSNFRLQGLEGDHEENFVASYQTNGVYLMTTYAGLGKYRPIYLATGENPIGTISPHIGLHPNATLGSPGWLTLGGDNGNQAVFIKQNSNNVNYLLVQGGITGITPSIATRGTDSSPGLNLDVQGASTVSFTSHSFNNTEFQVFGTGGTSWLAVGSSSSDTPTLSANGASANIGIKLSPKGTGAVTTNSPIQSASTILSTGPAGGIGYATGAGSVITQLTSKTTSVTLNTVTGQITLSNSALAAAATACFTLTNSTISAYDTLHVNLSSGNTSGAYVLNVDSIASGSAKLCINNRSASSLSEAVVINYTLVKGSYN